jgi:hypothetical protein
MRPLLSGASKRLSSSDGTIITKVPIAGKQNATKREKSALAHGKRSPATGDFAVRRIEPRRQALQEGSFPSQGGLRHVALDAFAAARCGRPTGKATSAKSRLGKIVIVP